MSDGERILKVHQHLPKLVTNQSVLFFKYGV